MFCFGGRINRLRLSCGLRAHARASLFAFCALLCISPFFAAAAFAQNADSISREQSIKAAYLYHLTKFVDWPKDHQHSIGETINLCVYGDSAFNQFLQHIESRSAKGRPIKLIKLVDKKSPESRCEIVYFSNKDQAEVELVQAYNQQATLTVSEQPDFLDSQGMVAMVLINNHIRLQINHTLAKQAGINMSANLLEVAALVK